MVMLKLLYYGLSKRSYVMARVNMEEIFEELDEQFSRVLKTVVDEVCPGNDTDTRAVMRIFRQRLERGFERWEHVPDRCVDAGY